ncbi:MAG: Lrp/AsnC family transcriptional regulator [Bacteroidetes bacterium]|jgi:DNA-binding Lrp family transcriptional regulator|nr:Lrp/AsnC family transcriptional regulator [Bacteroidota bacterium]
MTTAIVLLDVAQGQITPVAEALANLEGVSEVHSVAGRHDLVVIIRVKDTEALATLVTEQIRALDGIERSETLIGFRVHSQHDLEHLFSVGMEE